MIKEKKIEKGDIVKQYRRACIKFTHSLNNRKQIYVQELIYHYVLSTTFAKNAITSISPLSPAGQGSGLEDLPLANEARELQQEKKRELTLYSLKTAIHTYMYIHIYIFIYTYMHTYIDNN